MYIYTLYTGVKVCVYVYAVSVSRRSYSSGTVDVYRATLPRETSPVRGSPRTELYVRELHVLFILTCIQNEKKKKKEVIRATETDCVLVNRYIIYGLWPRARPARCDGCVECACFPSLVSSSLFHFTINRSFPSSCIKSPMSSSLFIIIGNPLSSCHYLSSSYL